jgi:hypothetical protein
MGRGGVLVWAEVVRPYGTRSFFPRYPGLRPGRIWFAPTGLDWGGSFLMPIFPGFVCKSVDREFAEKLLRGREGGQWSAL